MSSLFRLFTIHHLEYLTLSTGTLVIRTFNVCVLMVTEAISAKLTNFKTTKTVRKVPHNVEKPTPHESSFRLEIECNLSKDSSRTDDSVDAFECTRKCLNDLNNIELCRCHQNNEMGKRKCFLSETKFRLSLLQKRHQKIVVPQSSI